MITLESIKSDINILGLRVAAFESQQKKRVITTVLGDIELQDGEEYVGLIVSADGSKSHHVVLLPGERESTNWKDAMAWAESINGVLPDRCEGALLFATMKDQFKPEWHWLREQHASYSDYAWVQSFYDGYQDYDRKSSSCRARAVRRLAI